MYTLVQNSPRRIRQLVICSINWYKKDTFDTRHFEILAFILSLTALSMSISRKRHRQNRDRICVVENDVFLKVEMLKSNIMPAKK